MRHQCSAIHCFLNVCILLGSQLLVVVTNALEKYLLEEGDMASYTNIFSSHLYKQKQLFIRSFLFFRRFSSWHDNKTTTADFETCSKQCTKRLTNACSQLSNCRNHCACRCLKKAYVVNCKMPVYAQYNSAMFPLARVVQEKNTRSGLKKCLRVRTYSCFHAVQKKSTWIDWKNVCLCTLTFMWWNQAPCWCCGISKLNLITWFKLAFWIQIV